MNTTPIHTIDSKEFSGKRALVTGGTKALAKPLWIGSSAAAPPSLRRRARPLRKSRPASNLLPLTSALSPARTKSSPECSRATEASTSSSILSAVPAHPAVGRWLSPTSIGKTQSMSTCLRRCGSTRGFLPSMVEQKSGVIVHISSIQRRMPLYQATLA